MSKKLIAACMALAAFAALAIVPAAASASPTLTFPTGTKASTGLTLTGTNVGETVMTGAFNVRCTTSHMHGTVTENSGTSIKGNITAASFSGSGTGGDCTSAFGSTKVEVTSLPWCLSSGKEDKFEVRGGLCSEASRAIKFTLEITGTGPCRYEKSSVAGTFKTHPEDAVLTISEQEAKLYEGGFFCPSSGKLDMTFTLETQTAGGSWDPLYIS